MNVFKKLTGTDIKTFYRLLEHLGAIQTKKNAMKNIKFWRSYGHKKLVISEG